MKYSLLFDNFIITVDTIGAELVSVNYKNKERLWQNEDGAWAGKAPVLFPFASTFRVIVEGVDYKMPFHGLVRKKEFKFLGRTSNSLTFTISSDSETKKYYPFDFNLTIVYKVENDKLIVQTEVTNNSQVEMIYGGGGHESFAVSKKINNYCLEFSHNEDFRSLVYDQNAKRLKIKPIDLGGGNIIILPDDYLEECLIFRNIKSDNITLRTIEGKKVANIAFAGYKNLVVWHTKGSKFVCIEPWINLPDDDVSYNKELKYKEDLISLFPGQTKIMTRVIKYY